MTRVSNNQFNKVVLILIDGARPDVLMKEIMKGQLPNIKKYFQDAGTHKSMLTCFPSTTGPAYLPYLTGCFPGTCNLPGIRWFDKPVYAKNGWGFKSFRTYCGLEAHLQNKDIKPSITTAWQLFPKSFNIIGGITRGIKQKNNMTRWGRDAFYYYAHLTDHWSFIDHIACQNAVKVIRNHDFDFLFVVFPGVDEYAHRSSPFHPRTLQAYAEADTYLGHMIVELKKKNIFEQTLMLVVSDHGLSETSQHFDVGPWLEKEKKIKTLFHSNIFKFRFQAASMVSGNGMTHLYFKGEDNWTRRTPFEEFSRTSTILEDLRLRPEVALVCTQGKNKNVHVQTKSGHAFFSYDQQTKSFTYMYDRKDPLQIFEETSTESTRQFTAEESLKLTWDSAYPDVFVQMQQLFLSPRTGDIIISATPGFDLREKFEIPLHKASHGAICPEHMKVPLLMNYPIEANFIRSVDIFPTMLRLTGKEIPQGIDGRCLV